MKEQEYFPGYQEPENRQQYAESRKSGGASRPEDELFSYSLNFRIIVKCL